jgi:ElaB/YqjD/DUF883 family membrane-anchored ribosome-binding protein
MPPENSSSSPSAPAEPATPVHEGDAVAPVQQFRERFETLLPTIQKEWPEVARHTLEATRGSFDQAVEVISRQSGHASEVVKERLADLVRITGDQAHQVGDSLRSLEDQLESLLDELNSTLRPRIEKPVRERPLVSLGIAAGVGFVAGLLLASRRRSA